MQPDGLVRRTLALLVLLALLAIIVACDSGAGELEPTQEPTPGTEAPDEVIEAREAVLDFLRDGANECVPPAGVGWRASTGNAPEGFTVYRFTTGDCLMSVSYPQPPTPETIYHVTIGDTVTGFCWQANVSARGRVVDTGAFAELLPELANAAAVHCKEQGYHYEVRTQANDIRCGVCVFPDDSYCNAWAFFQGACKPGNSSANAQS